jgi:hypothetical protein
VTPRAAGNQSDIDFRFTCNATTRKGLVMPAKVRSSLALLIGFLFLAVGCATSDRASRDAGTQRMTAPQDTAAQVKRAKSAGDAAPETASPRVRPRESAAATRESVQEKRELKGESPAPLLEFKDDTTGLVFTYARPWYIVINQREGLILGKENRSFMTVRFATLTKDQKQAGQPGFLYTTADAIAGALAYALSTLARPISDFTGLDSGVSGGKKKVQLPIDIALTRKHFPAQQIESRFRGSDGRSIVQRCRHANLPDPFHVYHVIEGDKVASFLVSDVNNAELQEETQKIIHSTRLP